MYILGRCIDCRGDAALRSYVPVLGYRRLAADPIVIPETACTELHNSTHAEVPDIHVGETKYIAFVVRCISAVPAGGSQFLRITLFTDNSDVGSSSGCFATKAVFTYDILAFSAS